MRESNQAFTKIISVCGNAIKFTNVIQSSEVSLYSNNHKSCLLLSKMAENLPSVFMFLNVEAARVCSLVEKYSTMNVRSD